MCRFIWPILFFNFSIMGYSPDTIIMSHLQRIRRVKEQFWERHSILVLHAFLLFQIWWKLSSPLIDSKDDLIVGQHFASLSTVGYNGSHLVYTVSWRVQVGKENCDNKYTIISGSFHSPHFSTMLPSQPFHHYNQLTGICLFQNILKAFWNWQFFCKHTQILLL